MSKDHKHDWHFVEKIGGHYSPGYKDDNIEIESRYFPPTYKFICMCGESVLILQKGYSSSENIDKQ